MPSIDSYLPTPYLSARSAHTTYKTIAMMQTNSELEWRVWGVLGSGPRVSFVDCVLFYSNFFLIYFLILYMRNDFSSVSLRLRARPARHHGRVGGTVACH